MYAEIAAIIVAAAASSYTTYQLVIRHISVHLDEVCQKIEAEAEHSVDTLSQELTNKLEDLKKTHVVAIAAHVKQEVDARLAPAVADTCTFCKKLVAVFDKPDGNTTRCANCKKAGK